MRPVAAIAAVIVLSIAAAAPATAAEVSLAADDLTYDGFDGEDNALVVTRPSMSETTVVDAPDVVISPGPGCTNPEADNTATCTGALIGMTVHTRGGDDTVDVSSPTIGAGESFVNGGAGNDVLRGGPRREDLLGEGGDDLLEGGSNTDRIFGGAGRDIASYESETLPVTVDMSPNTANDGPAGAGDDVNKDGQVEGVIGGTAGDVITGTAAGDQIDGAGGDDSVDALAGPDVVFGGAGTDTLDGSGGADQVSGDGGVGAGPPAADELSGGPELDVVRYDERSEPVTVDLANPGSAGAPGEGDTLDAFEAARGGGGDDALTGDGGANLLTGGGGNDVLDGALGDDQLLGGTGSDTAGYGSRTGSVTATLSGTPGGGEAGEADAYEAVESLRGGAAADTLTGDGAPNTLEGGAGPDVLDGAGDRDLLRGGDDADTLNGGDGDDSVHGDAGSDTADGGAGEDSLRMRDGEADTVACGTELDTAIVDPVDALDGCEIADDGAPPQPIREVVEVPGPPGPPVPAAPGAQVPDATSPAIALGSLASRQKLASFKKGLKIRVGCDEPCSFDLELLGSANSVKLARTYDLRLASRSLPRGAGTRTVTLKPSRRLLGKHRKLSVQLKVTAVDAAGNKSTRTTTMKVR